MRRLYVVLRPRVPVRVLCTHVLLVCQDTRRNVAASGTGSAGQAATAISITVTHWGHSRIGVYSRDLLHRHGRGPGYMYVLQLCSRVAKAAKSDRHVARANLPSIEA